MTIIAAIDNSPMTRDVLERAIEQAKSTETTLHVVHVFHPPTALYSMGGTYSFEEETLADAERRIVWGTATPILDESGVDWIRHDMRGYPPAMISQYADEIGADLIVMGTRGRGGLSTLVLGSTSQGVIHDGTCDVLVVRPEIDEE